jgi:hypothetical protein
MASETLPTALMILRFTAMASARGKACWASLVLAAQRIVSREERRYPITVATKSGEKPLGQLSRRSLLHAGAAILLGLAVNNVEARATAMRSQKLISQERTGGADKADLIFHGGSVLTANDSRLIQHRYLRGSILEQKVISWLAALE